MNAVIILIIPKLVVILTLTIHSMQSEGKKNRLLNILKVFVVSAINTFRTSIQFMTLFQDSSLIYLASGQVPSVILQLCSISEL
jgi:hypothetical protein